MKYMVVSQNDYDSEFAMFFDNLADAIKNKKFGYEVYLEIQNKELSLITYSLVSDHCEHSYADCGNYTTDDF